MELPSCDRRAKLAAACAAVWGLESQLSSGSRTTMDRSNGRQRLVLCFAATHLCAQPRKAALHLRRPSKCPRRPRGRVSMSALDAIPEPLKLNAVAESLARSRDVNAALAVAAELRKTGAGLESRTRAAIVDAIASSPGPGGVEMLGQLFAAEPPAGFGAAAGKSLTATKASAALASGGPVAGADVNDAPDESVIPDAGRRLDMGLAVGFLAVVGTSVGAEVVEPVFLHHSAPEATAVLMMTAGGFFYDRYAAAGHWWSRVSAGMDRLLSHDPVREAHVESAHFLTAYLLGLPCAPFRPNVRQLLKLHGIGSGNKKRSSRRRSRVSQEAAGSDVVASLGQSAVGEVPQVIAASSTGALSATNDVSDGGDGAAAGTGSPGLSDALIDSYLVWLLSGVAAESMLDGVLVESDAAWARELLRAVAKPDESRIVAAYTRACDLLKRHQVAHSSLGESMLGGLSAGDCVSLLESKFAL